MGLITEWMSEEGLQKRSADTDLGGTMRLGAYPAKLKGNSHVATIYGATEIGSIASRLTTAGEAWTLYDGVGLRPGEAGLVFNRFWRGDPSRSRLTGGTGLGLAISLEDARLHDGWLQAWGERGVGSRFRLTLPQRAGDTLHGSPLPLTPREEP